MSTNVELKLTADLDSARKEVGSFRKEYADLIKQIEKPIRQVKGTLALEESLADTGVQIRSTKSRLKELQVELIRTDHPSEQLRQSFRDTGAELRRLERSEATQAAQLKKMRAELVGAGVDTSRLAQEQRRLNSELTGAVGAGRADADLQRQTANFQRAIQQAAQAKLAEQQRQAAATQGVRAQSAALKQQAVAQRQASIEAARNKFGVTQMRAARQELASLRQQYGLLRSAGNLTTRELATAQRQLRQRIRETKAEIKGLAGGFASSFSGIGKGGGAAAAITAVAAGVAVAATKTAQGSDEVGRLDARLKLATRSQEEFNTAQRELDRIADATQGDISGLVSLYGRLQRPLRDAGFGQKEALETVEAVSLALKIGGSTTSEADGAVRQFAQALASGTLRGDEFNSVIEQSDRLAGALADELGVTIGQLRELAESGKLTSDSIVLALGRQLPKLREEFSTFAPEIGAALERAGTELKRFWGRQAKESGISDFIATMVNDYAKGVNRFNDIAEAARTPEKLAALQRDMLEKEDVDRRIRRLAEEQRSAAEIAGVRYEDVSSLRSWAEQLGETYEGFLAREAERHRLREAGEISSKDSIRNIRRAAISDKQKEIAAQEELLKAANDRLEKARKRELDIEKEFSALVSEIRGGAGRQGASFAGVQDAQVGARRALADGDTERAIEEARRAGALLRELQQSGANDYGFAGIAEDLARIAAEASRIEGDDVESEVRALESEVERLKKTAEALKVVSVSVEWDQASAEQVRAKMEQLASDLAKVMIFRPTVLPPDGAGGTVEPSVPAAATGGILRGPGTGRSDSILARLSNGEGVLNARAVSHYGEGLVHRFNRLQLPKFADGGIVGARNLPAIPAMNPALLAPAGPAFPELGRLDLNFGGNSYELYASRGTAAELREQALKHGRTSKR